MLLQGDIVVSKMYFEKKILASSSNALRKGAKNPSLVTLAKAVSCALLAYPKR